MLIFRKFCFFFLLLLVTASLQAQTPNVAGQQATDIPLSADEVKPLQEGNKIPAVSLLTPEGDTFNLNAFVKEQPAVLIFYRGGWCPYCNAHLQELMEADSQLRSLGYQILAVSPDKPEKIAESIEKHEMTYRLLSDTAMTAAKAFGVAFKVEDKTIQKYKENNLDLEEASGQKHHLLPVPSAFIIDQEGIVRYVYYNSNIKARLKGETLIEKVKEVL